MGGGAADWRLGAMVFGGVAQERLQLNEDTLWSGAKREWNTAPARAALADVRRALFAGKYTEADQLAKQLQGPFTESYQPLGDLHLTFAHQAEATAYQRELDLTTALATTRYTVNGVTFTRTAFASAPDQAVILHLHADQPGQISFGAALSSRLRHQVAVSSNTMLTLTGKAPAHVEPSYRQVQDAIHYAEDESGPGLNFALTLRVMTQGGQVTSDDQGLYIAEADAVTLILTAATGFVDFDQSPGLSGAQVAQRVQAAANGVAQKTYADLCADHITDHQQLFQRVTLDLGATAAADLPADERIRRFKEHADPHLLALLFQYGRYLLIASSRPGTQPANLQGIWNDEIRPPWSANYTININTQNLPQYTLCPPLVFGRKSADF